MMTDKKMITPINKFNPNILQKYFLPITKPSFMPDFFPLSTLFTQPIKALCEKIDKIQNTKKIKNKNIDTIKIKIQFRVIKSPILLVIFKNSPFIPCEEKFKLKLIPPEVIATKTPKSHKNLCLIII